MKKLVLSLALPVALIFNSCKDCNMEMPDLTHMGSEFAYSLLSGQDPTSPEMLVKIGGEFLNEAIEAGESCACSNGTEAVERQSGRFQINEVSGDIIGDILKSELDETGRIEACDSELSEITFTMLKGASYLISFVLDATVVVDERNESNNDLDEGYSRPASPQEKFEQDKKKYGNNFKYQIVHLDENGVLYKVADDGVKTKIDFVNK